MHQPNPKQLRAAHPGQTLRKEFEQLRRADPNIDPITALFLVLGRNPLDAYFLLSMSEEFCRNGQAQDLVDLALTRRVRLPTPTPHNNWLNSALLPFLVLSGDNTGVEKALNYLEHTSQGWQLNGVLAWLARHSARHFKHLPQAYERLLAWMRLSEIQARDPWGRSVCQETLRTTLLLLDTRDHLEPDLANELTTFAIRVYGLLPNFWTRLDRLGTPPAPLIQSRADFEQLQSATLGLDAPQAGEALARMVKAGVHGLAQFCLELKRPDLCPPAVQEKIAEHNVQYPTRIWAASDVAASRALKLVAGHDWLESAQTTPVAVICVSRNERPMLPAFLDHYRRLGVGAFIVADNESDDGSAEWLAKQPDVVLFSAPGDFRAAQQGTEWKQALMAQLRPNRWSLVADADELLVAPALTGPGHPQGWEGGLDLPALLRQTEEKGWDALRILMLDLYPKGPLSQTQTPDHNPFHTIGFADQNPFVRQWLDRGPFGDRTALRSGLRHRLLPGSPPNLFVSEKVALLRYRPWMRLSVSLHYAAGIQLAPEPLVFGHFKYTAQFHDKVARAIEGGQFFDNSAEYHRYAHLLRDTGGQLFDPACSVPWTEAMANALQHPT